MQKEQPLSERVLLAVAILLGAGIVVVALVLAVRPDWALRYRTSPSEVRLQDYSHSTDGSEGGNLGGVPNNFKTRSVTGTYIPKCTLPLDDEKTSGRTNQVKMPSVLERRNAVPIQASDLMDIPPLPHPNAQDTAPVTTPGR